MNKNQAMDVILGWQNVYYKCNFSFGGKQKLFGPIIYDSDFLLFPKDLGPSNGRVWTCIAGVGSSKYPVLRVQWSLGL